MTPLNVTTSNAAGAFGSASATGLRAPEAADGAAAGGPSAAADFSPDGGVDNPIDDGSGMTRVLDHRLLGPGGYYSRRFGNLRNFVRLQNRFFLRRFRRKRSHNRMGLRLDRRHRIDDLSLALGAGAGRRRNLLLARQRLGGPCRQHAD